jgi:hypothetical protein
MSYINNNINKWTVEANNLYAKQRTDTICLTTESLKNLKRIPTNTHSSSTDLKQICQQIEMVGKGS